MIPEQPDIQMQNSESRYRSYIFHKNKLKMDHRHKCYMQNYKTSRRNTEKKIHDTWVW